MDLVLTRFFRFDHSNFWKLKHHAGLKLQESDYISEYHIFNDNNVTRHAAK